MVEILAPAGNPAALKAAVEGGADAVYMGSEWNARLRARNFTRDELGRAISYCHANNIKAYITLNTLIFEEELNGVKEYLYFLHEKEADAIIIQDLGVLRLARELGVSLGVHASTQLSVHNSKTAQILKDKGIKRIVLARELNFDQIKRIKNNVDVEIEIFGYGALCYSYSGKCLWSFIQTGRSGNRGICSQMCRFPWKLLVGGKEKRKGYLTSTKDLNLIEHVSRIKELGVESIKIEGRLKDAEYVRNVVSAFRSAIDEKDFDASKLQSNRGFTTGYLFGEAKTHLINPNSQIFRGKEIGKVVNVTKNGAVVELFSPLFIGDYIRSSSFSKAIKIYRIYKEEKEIKTGNGRCIIKIKNLKKGDKIYKIEPIETDSSFLEKYEPANRAIVKKEIRLDSLSFNPRVFKHYTDKGKENDLIYDWDFATENYKKIKHNVIYVETPRVVFDEELESVKKRMKEMDEWFLEKEIEYYFMISELSLVGENPFYVSHYGNVANTLAAREWLDLGKEKMKGVVAAMEVPVEHAKRLGFSVYEGSYIELAISENDWYSEFDIEGKAQLMDPKGNLYDIIKKENRTLIVKRTRSGQKNENLI